MRKIRTAKAHVAAQQEHRNAKLSDRNARWRLLENKGRFSACDVSLTKPSLSSGKSEDDETPQSGFLEVDDNVTSLGLRLLVPPKTFCDVIDTSTSCASKAQREPVESVRLAWRSRCPLQPQRFHLSLIHLNTKIALVSILF